MQSFFEIAVFKLYKMWRYCIIFYALAPNFEMQDFCCISNLECLKLPAVADLVLYECISDISSKRFLKLTGTILLLT